MPIKSIQALLSSHLRRTFRLDEDIVVLQPVTSAQQTAPTNRVHIFPVNIERETAGGISFNRQPVSGKHFKQMVPAFITRLSSAKCGTSRWTIMKYNR
jgi:hypothetical protein